MFLAPGVDFGGNSFAGAAPFGEGVDDNEFVGVVDGGVKFRLAIDVLAACFVHIYGARGTYLASCLTPIVTGEARNRVKEVDVNVRRAEADDAMRAVRAEVLKKDARLYSVLGKWLFWSGRRIVREGLRVI